jgi:hypothetical protein
MIPVYLFLKKIVPGICLLMVILLVSTACQPRTPQTAVSSPSTEPPDFPKVTRTAAAVIPSLTPSSAISTEIAAQFDQAVQAAQAIYQQSLTGEALREAQQGLERWREISWGEIEYAQANGDDVSAALQHYLRDLELRTRVNLKWAGYQERTPKQQEAARSAIEQYSGSAAAYQNSALWPFHWMVMAETYRSGESVYKIDVETDRIIEIEPVNDASISTPTSGSYANPEIGREKARAIITRLAPEVNLAALTLREDVSLGYYIWEDRSAAPLQDGGYPRIQVEFGPDGTFVNFINALPTE